MTLGVFLGLFTLVIACELAAMWITGSIREKRRGSREWTAIAITLPYKLMFLIAVGEHLVGKTDPGLANIAVGTSMVLLGVALRLHCHFQLREAFSGYVRVFDQQRLTQTGLYATIRHPMYLGSILLFVGFPLMLAAKYAFLASALGIVAILIRIPIEERLLSENIPGYREYVSRTWRLMPGVY